jgi:hypothetical protein
MTIFLTELGAKIGISWHFCPFFKQKTPFFIIKRRSFENRDFDAKIERLQNWQARQTAL